MSCDAAKKVKGRRIHALVDTEGLPMRLVVDRCANRESVSQRQMLPDMASSILASLGCGFLSGSADADIPVK